MLTTRRPGQSVLGTTRVLLVAAITLGTAATASASASVPRSSPPSDTAELVDYGDAAHWICRPDLDDVCDTGLDATVIDADGTTTAGPFVADPDAPIDCFYAYPTISQDATPNSDLIAGDEERFVVALQAAPLGTRCRVFAPLYRQITLASLAERVNGSGDIDPSAAAMAYTDVATAWQYYLDHDNGGRGVVLVGHSQGASLLTALIARNIETDPTTLDLLVTAFLAGTSLQVPIGRDVGGSLASVPLCRSADQFGCVVTWSSYRASSPPPPDGIFGRGDEGTEAGCTNPAALDGGRAPLHSRFPSSPDVSMLSGLGANTDGATWIDPSADTITTPYVELPGIVTGGCVHWNGYSWLEIDPQAEPGPRADDVRGDLTPRWGLHLIDMSLVMGDLQALVTSQGEAWAADR